VTDSGRPRGVEVHAIARDTPLPDAILEAQFLVPPHGGPEVLAAMPHMPSLRVVQSLSAGVEWLLPHVPDGVTVCNARGARDTAVAEWVVAAVLSAAKRLADFRDGQREARWEPAFLDEVAGRRALIVGHGSIGRAVEARLAALGVETQRVARTARPAVHPVAHLTGLLPTADYTIVLVPLTNETRHLIGETELAQMKPGSVLINASRGPVVDTNALLEHTSTGRIRAVLDVTDPEPPPPDHPLWTARGVTITPHSAGDTREAERRAHELVAAQLRRYAAGEPLENVVAGAY
jgi:phosphoglycerate dehydrogenase-like enzyme